MKPKIAEKGEPSSTEAFREAIKGASIKGKKRTSCVVGALLYKELDAIHRQNETAVPTVLVKDGAWQVPVERRPIGWQKYGAREK